MLEKEDDSKLTRREMDVACFIEQVYLSKGEFPTNERIAQEFAYTGIIDLEFVQKLTKKKVLWKYLASRGIEREEYESHVLTPDQLLVVRAVLNSYDKRTLREKLKVLGVSPTVFQKWMRQPSFNKFLRDQAAQAFGEFDWEAFQSLMENVRDGDTPSIKLYLEMTGHYIPRSVQEVNPSQLITQVIEIVAQEVEPEVLMRIAERLELLLPKNPMTAVGERNLLPPIPVQAIETNAS